MTETLLGVISGVVSLAVILLNWYLNRETPQEIARDAAWDADRAVANMERRKLDEVRDWIRRRLLLNRSVRGEKTGTDSPDK